MMFLYNSRVDQDVRNVPADHWALIATEQIFESGVIIDKEIKEKLISHANKVVKSMLLSRVFKHKIRGMVGALNSEGRPTPTSIRVEGLTAIYDHLTDSHLKELTFDTIKAAAKFLLNAQIPSGKYSGAWTRSMLKVVEDSKEAKKFNKRRNEIRIDYVQHALSALINTKKMNATN